MGLFRQRFHAATVSDVAAEAGVTQGTVYHYFDSKESLLQAAYTQSAKAILRDEIAKALQAEPIAARKLALIAQAATLWVIANLQLCEVSGEFWSHIQRKYVNPHRLSTNVFRRWQWMSRG